MTISMLRPETSKLQSQPSEDGALAKPFNWADEADSGGIWGLGLGGCCLINV